MNYANRLAGVIATILVATAGTGLVAAHAGERGEPGVRIRIGGLRLSRPTDAAAFMTRVEAAADEVCEVGAKAERLSLAARACMDDVDAVVRASLTAAQRADLRTARRATPALFGNRSFAVF